MSKDRFIIKDRMVPFIQTVDALTDQSIALLNEMQEKTFANILRTIKVEDNTLNAVVVYTVLQACQDDLAFTVKFKFNGKEHRIDGIIPRSDLDRSKYGSSAAMIALAKSVCLLFAENVVENCSPVLITTLTSAF